MVYTSRSLHLGVSELSPAPEPGLSATRPPESNAVEKLILSLTAAVGVILMLLAPKFGYAQEVLSKLGDALVIAALVGFFVEIRLIGEAVKRIEASADARLLVTRSLRRYLPKELVDALETQMLDPQFLREEMKVKMSLWPEGQHVKGKVWVSYFVRNLSLADQEFRVRFNLDEMFGTHSADLEGAVVDDKQLTLSNLPEGSKLCRESNFLRFEYPAMIPAGKRISVTLWGVQRMAKTDVWAWHFLAVADSLRVTVNYDSSILWALLVPHHPVAGKREPEAPVEPLELTINEIVLPYQGFELRWRPLESPATDLPTPPARKPPGAPEKTVTG
jgi:hypothetical protein